MSTAKTLTKGRFEWNVANRLKVDQRYERPVSAAKVKQIANQFDPDAFGVVYVSRRANGDLVIIDGQHRVAAVKHMGWGEQKVPCHTYVSLSLEQEAALFTAFNEVRTKPRPLDLHRAKVVAGDVDAVAVEKVLADRGLRFQTGQGVNTVGSISLVYEVYRGAGTKTLATALDVCMNVWGRSSEALVGEVIAGVAVLIARYEHLDVTRLESRLRTIDRPMVLVRQARLIRAQLGEHTHRLTTVVAQLLVKEYNVRLTDEKRLDWEDRPAALHWHRSGGTQSLVGGE